MKRLSSGENWSALVDIYNGLSLKYGIPVGGEDIDKFEGNVRLTLASGDEEFMTLGSEKSEPPSPGEIVYKDDAGAICRCFNWREAVRTMLTEETTNAFMCIETLSKEELPVLEEALEELKNLIEKELSGTCEKYIVSAESPEIVISN
ncbi:MAG: B3/4 domain-containing protein [Anaerovoracaceae bacterium]